MRPRMSINIISLLLLYVLILFFGSATSATDDILEIICPEDNDDVTADPVENDYCTCFAKTVGLSKTLQVKCDLRNEKKVLLTEKIYKIRKVGFSSAYVRIINALEVTVTSGFMREWQQALSSALDLWHSGTVSLASSPTIYKQPEYKTFVGFGIINCEINNIPPKLIRDHHRGALRIKESKIDVVHPNFIHNIDELRYLVFEDCIIKKISGPASSTGMLTLSSKELHSWNGLLMSNVSVETIESRAFNLTHKSDVESVVIHKSHFGQVNTGSFAVSGDISVNVSSNVFEKLLPKAFQVRNVVKLDFNNNRVESWATDALSSLVCPSNRSSINKNVMVTQPANSLETMLFHSSCGNPKMELVVSNSGKSEKVVKPKSNGGESGAMASVVVMLIVLCGGGMAGLAWWWRGRSSWRTRDVPLCEDQDQPDITVSACHMNNKPEPTIVLS